MVFAGFKSEAPIVAVNSSGTMTGGPDFCGVRVCIAHASKTVRLRLQWLLHSRSSSTDTI